MSDIQQIFLQVGQEVPVLTGLDQQEQEVKLQDFKGKKVIIFFYPKDNTPTCTKEACNFRDNYSIWQEKGYEVIGVSPDKPKSHQKFIDKFDLPYTLIADTEQEWLNAFGVWGKKKMYGREYMGVHRTTFIIDENGVVSHVIYPVKSADHTNQILGLIEPEMVQS